MKKKRLVEIESEDFGDDTDSEAEALQEAFAKGDLKPGLNVLETETKKDKVNNVTGLKQKLIELSNNLDWIERLDLINKPASMPPELEAQLADAEKKKNLFAYDELKHESLFYRQAQDAVLEGIPKLHCLGIATQRPEDYFAEMAKSDEHMQKVKAELIKKKTVMEKVEKVRQMRQQKKLQKALQAQSRVSKQNAKKELLDQVKKFRKGERKDLGFLDGKPSKDSAKNNRAQQKRKYRDSKFGFGGKKRGLKKNTRDSTMGNDSQSKKKAKGKGKAKPLRPGKTRRMKMKASKKR